MTGKNLQIYSVTDYRLLENAYLKRLIISSHVRHPPLNLPKKVCSPM